MPGLDAATQPEAVADRVAQLAPMGVRTVPLGAAHTLRFPSLTACNWCVSVYINLLWS